MFGIVSINIDGMDKAKTTVPNIGKSSGTGQVWKVTGVRLHSSSSKDRLFFSSMFAGDTNLNLECLCRALNDQLIENREKLHHQGEKDDVQFTGSDLDDSRGQASQDNLLPEVKVFRHAFLQMDNTCKDNKNWILMSLLCAMVWFEVGGLETFEVGFMQVPSCKSIIMTSTKII